MFCVNVKYQSQEDVTMTINKVFLFVPNMLSYARILLYIGGFFLHTTGHWQWCAILYTAGFLGDYWDGVAARKLNQCSKFGAALEMVSDRTATAGLCVILAHLYPRYIVVFILLIALDIGSHYYLLYLTSLQGEKSHKDSGTQSEYRLLNAYYGNVTVLRLLVTGNEFFYIFLYSAYYAVGPGMSLFTKEFGGWQIAILICLPFYVLKQWINILQLKSSAGQIARIDLKERAKQKESAE